MIPRDMCEVSKQETISEGLLRTRDVLLDISNMAEELRSRLGGDTNLKSPHSDDTGGVQTEGIFGNLQDNYRVANTIRDKLSYILSRV